MDQLADLVAARVCAWLEERMHRSEPIEFLNSEWRSK